MYDAIVVGSGLTGGWAAMKLCQAGLRVLVLEAGRDVTLEETPEARSQRPLDPAAASAAVEQRKSRPIQSQHGAFDEHTSHLFVDDNEHPFSTPPDKPFVWIRSRHTGGRSLLWGGVTLRLSDFEFKAAQRDGIGDDWPISYKDIAPYYDEVEQFLGVTGTRDGLDVLPDGKCISAPPMTESELFLKSRIEATWPERTLITSRAIKPNENPENRWPKRTSTGTTLHAAQATGLLTLKNDSIAERVLMDKTTGRAGGILVRDRKTHASTEVRAKIIVLCASTLESTRLLLNSANEEFPDGLANSSGALGCYLMDHPSVMVGGWIPGVEPGPEVMSGNRGFCIPRFRNVSTREKDFVRGYGILGCAQRSLGSGAEQMLRMCGAVGPGAPFVLGASIEMLPRKENRVTIDPNLKDSDGIPALHINCSFAENELALLKDAEEQIYNIAKCAGFQPLLQIKTKPGGFVHEMGTTRMGGDRRTSVLNSFNQCWDVANLFVLDGGAFVSSGWQNPSLTMMALAARACDHIVKRLRLGEV